MYNLWIKFTQWIAKIWLVLFVLALIIFAIFFQGAAHPSFFPPKNMVFYIAGVQVPVWFLIKGGVAIITIFSVASFALERLEDKIHHSSFMTKNQRVIVIKVTQIAVYVLVFILGLDILNLDLATFTVFGGAIGIGIGLGLQSVVANFISGLVLASENSIESDDLIELSDGTLGNVRYIGARNTLVTTATGVEIVVPNETLITNQIKNWTYTGSKVGIKINISIAYDNDIDLAMKLMVQAAIEHQNILNTSAPKVYVDSIYYDTVNLVVFFYLNDVTIQNIYTTKSDVMLNICEYFKADNIQIATFPPSPQDS